VRIDIRKIAQIKKGEDVIGSRTRAKVVKNKVAAPFKQAEFDLVYNEGISRESEMLMFGEKYGLIKKMGSSYSYGDVKIGRGYDSARVFLKTNKAIAKEITKEILKQMKSDDSFSVSASADDKDEGSPE